MGFLEHLSGGARAISSRHGGTVHLHHRAEFVDGKAVEMMKAEQRAVLAGELAEGGGEGFAERLRVMVLEVLGLGIGAGGRELDRGALSLWTSPVGFLGRGAADRARRGSAATRRSPPSGPRPS